MADQRHGIATAVLANVNRDPKKKPDAYKANDFIYWHESNRQVVGQRGILSADPKEQSRLIKQALFKSK
ncbi:hypothetical protein [Polaromonas jejuensis]|uniref:hypothetical protein n=1 Tax=Polaromonas jejuensis TaxID=457502 RepID=UPI003BB77F34